MRKEIKILIGAAATLAVGAAVFLRCPDGLKKNIGYIKIQIYKLFNSGYWGLSAKSRKTGTSVPMTSKR